ncbi:hypothetical protein HK405_010551, partial [Cladochytrium tenue]
MLHAALHHPKASASGPTPVAAATGPGVPGDTQWCVIKEGWLLKKAGSGLLAPWRQKYAVLLAPADVRGRPIPSPQHCLLQLHDTHCDRASQPPKHLLTLGDCRIENAPIARIPPAAAAAAAAAVGGGGKPVDPFVIVAKQRKFYLAAQSKGDSVSWRSHLSPNTPVTTFATKAERFGTPLDVHRRMESVGYRQAAANPAPLRRQMSEVADEYFDDAASMVSSLAPSITEAEDIRSLSVLETLEIAVANAMKMVDEYHLTKRGNSKADLAGNSIVVDGIVLHFACDYDEPNSGEATRIASARAASELLAIDAVNQTRCGLATALMALVDYKGFRVVAFADMGIEVK